VDGVAAGMSNLDLHGLAHHVGPRDLPHASTFDPGPPHDENPVREQIDNGNMSGFVRAFQRQYPEHKDLEPGHVMRQLQRAHQPMTHFLADEFTICNRWFSAVPADTIPNRLYSLAGDAGGVTSTRPDFAFRDIPELDSIFEQLDPEHWMLFSGCIPLAFAVSPIRTVGLDLDRWHSLSDFAAQVPHLPKLTWIDPTYYWLDGADGIPRRFVHVDKQFPLPNDDHPPSHTECGQQLIRYVYESLIAHPAVWAGTLFVVTYDEHGGFFDHVKPPPIAPGEIGADKFDHRGPRVPALVVSPYAARGAVCTATFDHCSILKFLCDWLGLPAWTPRIASGDIASLAEALTKVPRADAPAPSFPDLPIPSEAPPPSVHAAHLAKLVAAIQQKAHEEKPEVYTEVMKEAHGKPRGAELGMPQGVSAPAKR
jgi:phospholipase C